MSLNNNNVEFSVAEIDETRRIIFGEVYAPNRIDAYGWYMEPKEVEKMAYKFMRLDLGKVIDTNHDNVPNGAYPVESFIAREGDPTFSAGAWVLGVKITNEKLWERVVKGELNAFSMEIYVKKVPAVVQYNALTRQVGTTEMSTDGEHPPHTHYYYAEVDPSTGRVVSGKTNEVYGHSHDLDVNSVTENAAKHTHRYFLGK